jgi:hypothetical protein
MKRGKFSMGVGRRGADKTLSARTDDEARRTTNARDQRCRQIMGWVGTDVVRLKRKKKEQISPSRK